MTWGFTSCLIIEKSSNAKRLSFCATEKELESMNAQNQVVYILGSKISSLANNHLNKMLFSVAQIAKKHFK